MIHEVPTSSGHNIPGEFVDASPFPHPTGTKIAPIAGFVSRYNHCESLTRFFCSQQKGSKVAKMPVGGPGRPGEGGAAGKVRQITRPLLSSCVKMFQGWVNGGCMRDARADKSGRDPTETLELNTIAATAGVTRSEGRGESGRFWVPTGESGVNGMMATSCWPRDRGSSYVCTRSRTNSRESLPGSGFYG